MPELPEVETVVRGLQQTIIGETIVELEVPWEKTFPLDDAYDAVVGQTIRQVRRRAKYIVIELDQGALVVHLRMTGKLTPVLPERHITAIFHFHSGNALYFQDTRKFGRIAFTRDTASMFAHLGPEPLDPTFSSEQFRQRLQRHKRIIKSLLLDQRFLAGLGNIYVDEALFQAGIHPRSIASKIPLKATQRLFVAIRQILGDSIKAQGTTVFNFSHGNNQSGTYQAALQVYGRQQSPCLICNTPLEKIKLGQRGTHFCPACQVIY